MHPPCAKSHALIFALSERKETFFVPAISAVALLWPGSEHGGTTEQTTCCLSVLSRCATSETEVHFAILPCSNATQRTQEVLPSKPLAACQYFPVSPPRKQRCILSYCLAAMHIPTDRRCRGAIPALSQMVVGMARRARAKAAIASERLPGVRAACSSTTCEGNIQGALKNMRMAAFLMRCPVR